MLTRNKTSVQSQEEFKEIVRNIATMPTHPDIPEGAILTGRQLYVEFCYRMARFDDEFKTLDPVLASSWLNIGMTRMIQEMQKRLFKAEQDIDVVSFFKGYFEDLPLVKKTGPSETSPYVEYFFDMPNAMHKEGKFGISPLKIWVRLNLTTPIDASGKSEFPKYVPNKIVDNPVGFDPGRYMTGVPFLIDYRDITELEVQHLQFIAFNSFSSVGQFPPRAYIHKHNSGYVSVYMDNIRMPQYTSADLRQEPFPPYRWEVTDVTHEFVKIDQLYKDMKIDTMGSIPIKSPPTEFHHDIVDYAIDAYFESIFFQSFGKYSMKMARRDSDTQANVTTGGSQYRNKLDSVPPTRYRLQHGAAAQAG